ncbi:MAG: apolipoprotein N-acyltransferase [Saprospiraceae bacterium]|nr:apolipoprotein N-acyltransferase [Saprospiraceae bacterium]
MLKRLNIFLSLVGFLIAGFSAYKMSELKLWSNYPLFLFIGLWIGLVLLYDYFFNNNNQDSNKLLFYSALSGLLLSIGFPPYGLTPLLFIGFVPLFFIQEECDKKGKSSLFYIYNSFVLWNIYTTYWVSNAALLPGVVAIWLNALFMLVPWYLSVWVGRKKPILQSLSFVSFWCCFELLHLHWEISWPWLNLGNAWSALPSWIQWYEYTGTFGGTFWILLLNVFIFSLFFKKNSHLIQFFPRLFSTTSKKVLLVLSIIFLPLVFSIIRFYTYVPTGRYGEVCLVQPNYEPHFEKFSVPEIDQITRLGRLAEASMSQQTKFVVFPETCFGDAGGPIRSDKLTIDNRIILLYDFIETHFFVPIVMGLTTINFLEANSNSKFKRISPKTKQEFEIANSAVMLRDRQEQVKVYNKSKLVPGAEIFPYKDFLPFLSPIVDKLNGSTSGLATQNDRTVFENNGYKIAPVICYESIYGDYMRGYMKNGAQAIFVMTNDGWWDDTPGYKQHMAYSKLRAIEFRKPVVRSANTGISCFIDAKGTVGKALGYNIKSAITQGISFSDETTFYCKYGDLIAYTCLIISILTVLFRTYLIWNK